MKIESRLAVNVLAAFVISSVIPAHALPGC
jgi:hypothetical protein